MFFHKILKLQKKLASVYIREIKSCVEKKPHYSHTISNPIKTNFMKTKTFCLTRIIPILAISIFTFTSCEKIEDPAIPENDKNHITSDITQLKSTATNGIFYIINRNSGKALDLNVSTGNVIQYTYYQNPNQKWQLTDLGNGYYRLSPLSNTSLALDIASQSTENGANLGTYSYWGGANQQFQFVDVGGGYYKIINRNSGKALDVNGSSTASGANVLQWDYWGGANQQWMLNAISTSASGQLSWRFTTTSGVPQDVINRITTAMNAAVSRYNSWGNWSPRTLTVEYNTGVPTADANISGHIRFGSNTSYMTECTAMHEISHTYGVGTSSSWSYPLIQDYKFVGANAVAKIHEFDGSSATISTGGSHFWPYGLNYNSEWSTTNGDRNAQLVWAMVQDGIY